MQAPAEVPSFFRVHQLPTINSTSEELKRLGRGGAPEGTLVWALRQTAGHGRFGRPWISPVGNLYFSLLLRPRSSPQEVMQLTFVAALAVAEAVSRPLDAGARVSCKWPNDVLISGKKVAGILLESELEEGGTVNSLVIGAGVNIVSHPPPEAVEYPATSLWAEGAGAETARSVLERFCPSFLVWHDRWRAGGFQPVREAWLARADRRHRRIEVRMDGETASGIFADLDPSGALVLQQDGGQRRIFAGDVFPADG